MKTTAKTMIAALTALMACMQAGAQGTFTLTPVSGAKGTTIEVPVGYTNNGVSITSFNFDLHLPEGVEVARESGEIVASLSSRSQKHSLEALEHTGFVRFLAHSTQNRPFTGEDGTILTASITLNAAPGEYELTLNKATATESGTFKVIDCPEVKTKLTITQAEVSLIHGTPYTNDSRMEDVNVSYTRTFSHTGWQALYVPFAMPYGEWSEKGKVAQLTGVSGTAEAPVLEWTTVTEGSLEANKPYIIKPTSEGEVTFSAQGAALEAADNGTASVSGEGGTFTLTGIYLEKTDMMTSGAYGLSGGEFRRAGSDNQALKPYLIYLTVSAAAQQSPTKVSSRVDGEATAITGIGADTTSGTRHDLTGREAAKSANGIIIENGRKYYDK